MHAAQRGSDLTNKLLSFTRNRTVDNDIVNINDVLIDDHDMLARTITAHIKLNMKLEDDIWPVFVDKGSLEDVILNMSINAMHAMPGGGTLEFSTSNTHVGTLDSQVLNISKGDYIKLSISDTGTGISNEVASRIFEPFFTTKGEKGTGLGLSQAYNFVTEPGGTIRVYSEPGHGTCFSLYIPRYHMESIDGDIDDQVQPLVQDKYHGSETILVVDDEPSLRELNKQILSAQGYNVICAEGGKQALSILEKEDIVLVISDVVMPEMDGYELAHLIWHIYPNTKIQLCSGFDEVRGKTVTNLTLQKNILHKPFTGKDLLQHVYELLNGPADLQNTSSNQH